MDNLDQALIVKGKNGFEYINRKGFEIINEIQYDVLNLFIKNEKIEK